MGVITWGLLRQAEALCDSVADNLEFGAFRAFAADFGEDDLNRWLHEHGMGESVIPGCIHIAPSMQQYLVNHCGLRFLKAGQRSAHPDEEDFGVERSSAGWQNLDNFIITSAFVRLLGASEKFEIDTLKALLYYRPSGGLGHALDQDIVTATSDVVTEKPTREDNNEVFQKPALWTWVKRHAENNVERRRILKNVYGIQTVPDPYKNKRLDDWYEKRNAIAHGRDPVEVKLSEYCDLYVFVAKSAQFVAEQCNTRLNLVI